MRLSCAASAGPRPRGLRTFAATALGLLLLVGAAGNTPAANAAGDKWVATWVTAVQAVEDSNLPPAPGLAHASLRQVIQPTLDGTKLRLTFSNAFGEQPLVLGAVTVAQSAGAARLEAGTVQAVTFNGQAGATIPPGAAMISDPLQFTVQAFGNLAITAYVTALPAPLTGHPGSRTTSYLLPGDHTADTEWANSIPTDHWYLLASADVWAPADAAAILVLGDSITDGRGSTTNLNDRWPNLLARRLHADPRTANIAVLNQGIGGNRLLRRGLGPSALERFDRDVLAPPGVRWVIVLEGINDLGTAVGARTRGEPAATAQEITHAYDQMIQRARDHGLVVYGATVMPFEGFDAYYTPASEADRQSVNAWIRESGRFDGVIDFDAITRDAEHPLRLSPAVDSGDHLHPSAAGYRIMAEAVDLNLFTSPER